MNDDALSDLLDVSVVEPDKLRPPKPSREADQEQGAVAHVLGAVPHRGEDLKQIVTEQRRSLVLRRTASALYASWGRFYQLSFSGAWKSRRRMSFGERGDPPGQGRHCVCLGMLDEVTGDHSIRGRD